MLIVFIPCPFLIWAAWSDLSNRAAAGFLLVSVAMVAGFFVLPERGGWFIAAQAVIDIILTLIAFGGDVHIGP